MNGPGGTIITAGAGTKLQLAGAGAIDMTNNAISGVQTLHFLLGSAGTIR